MARSDSSGGSVAKIVCVVGARPNFMKIAPVMAAMKSSQSFVLHLVHTGQHYDAAMNHQYFEALDIPLPDTNLEVGSGSHAVQTAEIMRRFEPVLEREQAAAIVVVGDVNSTLACALVAAKKGVPVVHVEAGLRSYDRAMPEEINRVLTDQISDLLFTTERDAQANLLREGIDPSRIHFVGNVMIDTLHHNLKQAVSVAETLCGTGRADFLNGHAGYAVLTLHRPSNVDDPTILKNLLTVIREISLRTPVIFPIHPRTRAMIEQFSLAPILAVPSVLLLQPLGYLEMLGLMKDAELVLTDSGGIQEETTALGVPCLTLRNNTERPITVAEGTNTIVGQDPRRIMTAFEDILRQGGKVGRVPELWDGRAAQRISAVLAEWLGSEATRLRVANSS